ncbi:hypothetical protein BDW42DRAFT_160005, partial [Aspergillus taichungensis]
LGILLPRVVGCGLCTRSSQEKAWYLILLLWVWYSIYRVVSTVYSWSTLYGDVNTFCQG